jgi:hypothetical protein
MGLQVLLGLPLGLALFALSIAAALPGDQAKQQRCAAWARRLVLGYGGVAFVLALQHWWTWPDWMRLLWTSTHPQMVLFVGAGAFLMRDEWSRRAGDTRLGSGPWIVMAALLAFALLPAVLIQWAPLPDPGPRNLGRPIAGTLEVARFGLGGPLPPALVPENDAGVARGLGFLPREITVPVGALATFAVLWVGLCCVQVAGALLRPLALRRGCFLLAPFGALALLFRPMPFGLNEATLWPSEPTLMRGFGPLLLTAALASVLVPLGQWLARRNSDLPGLAALGRGAPLDPRQAALAARP